MESFAMGANASAKSPKSSAISENTQLESSMPLNDLPPPSMSITTPPQVSEPSFPVTDRISTVTYERPLHRGRKLPKDWPRTIHTDFRKQPRRSARILERDYGKFPASVATWNGKMDYDPDKMPNSCTDPSMPWTSGECLLLGFGIALLPSYWLIKKLFPHRSTKEVRDMLHRAYTAKHFLSEFPIEASPDYNDYIRIRFEEAAKKKCDRVQTLGLPPPSWLSLSCQFDWNRVPGKGLNLRYRSYKAKDFAAFDVNRDGVDDSEPELDDLDATIKQDSHLHEDLVKMEIKAETDREETSIDFSRLPQSTESESEIKSEVGDDNIYDASTPSSLVNIQKTKTTELIQPTVFSEDAVSERITDPSNDSENEFDGSSQCSTSETMSGSSEKSNDEIIQGHDESIQEQQESDNEADDAFLSDPTID